MANRTNPLMRGITTARAGMVANRAGGEGWEIDPWTLLDRFLVLGATENTYYASAAELSFAAAKRLIPLIQHEGPRAVERSVAISMAGRAPRNEPALALLALALAEGDAATKQTAVEATPLVARTGTHIQTLADYLTALRGHGRAARRALARWFTAQPARDLAYQAIKYQNRAGWSLRSVARVAHPRPVDADHNAVLHWITHGWDGVGAEPHPNPALVQLWAVERLRRLPGTAVAEAAQLIADYRIPREGVPTHFLSAPEVWAALLPHMPLTALLRNLATLTRYGVITPLAEATRSVAARITDATAIRRARIHPLHAVIALQTYQSGQGMQGRHQWEPVPQIVAALEELVEISFTTASPTGRRILFALDVSGSMQWPRMQKLGMMTPIEIGAIMLMAIMRCEPAWHGLAFHTEALPIPVTPRMTMREAMKVISELPSGGSDLGAPIRYAIRERIDADALVVFTDNETWANGEPVDVTLDRYRQQVGHPVAAVVIAATATHYSVLRPSDPQGLNIAGFDSAAPALVRDFIADAFASADPESNAPDDA